MDQPTFADSLHTRSTTRREKFLERLQALVPWQRLGRAHYPKAGRGRRPYALSVMPHLVQLCYNLDPYEAGAPVCRSRYPESTILIFWRGITSGVLGHLAAHTGGNRGRDHHCGAVRGNASGEEGEPVLLWDCTSERTRPRAWWCNDAGQRARDASTGCSRWARVWGDVRGGTEAGRTWGWRWHGLKPGQRRKLAPGSLEAQVEKVKAFRAAGREAAVQLRQGTLPWSGQDHGTQPYCWDYPILGGWIQGAVALTKYSAKQRK